MEDEELALPPVNPLVTGELFNMSSTSACVGVSISLGVVPFLFFGVVLGRLFVDGVRGLGVTGTLDGMPTIGNSDSTCF